MKTVFCDLCTAAADSVEAAIAADWSASYFIDDEDTGRPICAACTEKYCEVAEDGELQLKADCRFPRNRLHPADIIKIRRVITALTDCAQVLYRIGSPDSIHYAEQIDAILASDNSECGLIPFCDSQKYRSPKRS